MEIANRIPELLKFSRTTEKRFPLFPLAYGLAYERADIFAGPDQWAFPDALY